MPDQIMSASGGPVWMMDSAGRGIVTGSLEATFTNSYINVIGSPNYSLPITGSVALSNTSINVDVTVADYVSIIGSPNYNLPVIGSQLVTQGTFPWAVSGTMLGSVQISSITSALPAGTNIIGSVISKGDPFDTSAQGTVWITTSSVRIMEPRAGRQSFRVIPTGSTSSLNVNGKIWFTPGPTAATFQGAECVLGQPWGVKYWEGSVAGITDAGSIAISYYEVF